MIKLTRPLIEETDLAAVRAALESGYLVQGPRVAEFEAQLAAYTGMQHAVALNSCTSALHLALLVLGTGPGDLVVLTAYSFTATANVVELCGARPVFVDLDQTSNMAPAALRARLAELKAAGTLSRVKAIMPVHTFGQMADMAGIGAIAAEAGIPVVEDAACALGATFNGRAAGSMGAMGCFSFHPRKTLTTGEGGAVVTNDAALAKQLRVLRNHGIDTDGGTTDFVRPGYNYRLTEFQAAFGLVQLAKLNQAIAARRRAAARYDALLAGGPAQAPVIAAGRDSVYQSYVVLLPKTTAGVRDAVIKGMRGREVEATIGTWHIPMTTFYRETYGYRPGDFPQTDATFAQSITLPLYEHITEAEQQQVVAALLAAMADAGLVNVTTTR